jgi:hypothetical protein
MVGEVLVIRKAAWEVRRVNRKAFSGEKPRRASSSSLLIINSGVVDQKPKRVLVPRRLEAFLVFFLPLFIRHITRRM